MKYSYCVDMTAVDDEWGLNLQSYCHISSDPIYGVLKYVDLMWNLGNIAKISDAAGKKMLGKNLFSASVLLKAST